MSHCERSGAGNPLAQQWRHVVLARRFGAMASNSWLTLWSLYCSTIPARWLPAGVRSAAPGTTLAVPALWPTTPGSATTTSSLPVPWLRMRVGSYYVGEDGKWIPGYGLVWYKSGSHVYHTHKCRTVGKDAKGYSQISIQEAQRRGASRECKNCQQIG